MGETNKWYFEVYLRAFFEVMKVVKEKVDMPLITQKQFFIWGFGISIWFAKKLSEILKKFYIHIFLRCIKILS